MALTQVDQGLLGSNAQYTGFKNKVINGWMTIDQRNNGSTVNTHNSFPVDRFQMTNQMTSGVFTSGRSTDVPTGEFTNSLICTVTTAQSSISVTSDYSSIRHKVEGYNMAGLGQGTAASSSFTLSFWVKSTQTGTWCVQFTNGNGRFYLSTYTVNNSATWEYKTITVTGDSSGTWNTTTGIGLQIWWTLACGADFQTATTNTWVTSATSLMKTSAQNNFFATNGNTWQITGVQLEKGSTATSFDYRPYGTELQLCQRYFIRTNPTGQNGSGGLMGAYTGATTASVTYSFPVTMRSAPTVVRSSAGGNGDTFWVSNISASSAGTSLNVTTSTTGMWQELTGMSSAAVGYPAAYNGSLQLSSEL